MTKKSTSQTLTLEGLNQGHNYTLVITNAQSDVSVQFKHASDPTWRDMPNVNGSQADVITHYFFCFTPTMQIAFASAPTEPYFVSCICEAMAEF